LRDGSRPQEQPVARSIAFVEEIDMDKRNAAGKNGDDAASLRVLGRTRLPPLVFRRRVTLGNVEVIYREEGPAQAPVALLLHGFPSSSHIFRNLIPLLAREYRVLAPDYPGFGHSAMPAADTFEYSLAWHAAVLSALMPNMTTRVAGRVQAKRLPGLQAQQRRDESEAGGGGWREHTGFDGCRSGGGCEARHSFDRTAQWTQSS
jgi:hypothetical protein